MTGHLVKVLIIDEDTVFLEEAVNELSGRFMVSTSATGGKGIKVFKELRPQVVIVDTGISDIPFPRLIDELKFLDGAVLRIAVSRDYSTIDEVVEAIDTAGVHSYFRKPLNYFDLIQVINARTAGYYAGQGLPHSADARPAYEKLHSIIDKAKEVERLRENLEAQMAKIKDVEAESFSKITDAIKEVKAFRQKLEGKDALISQLKEKSLELEALKKRDIDRVEQERAALRQELNGLRDGYDNLVREKAEIEQALKELDFLVTSEKEATLRVSETLKKADRVKKDGKDSILVVDDEADITLAFTRMMKNRFNVYTADSGESGLNVLEENPDICMIVTDQRMPEMTGTEFAAEVRKKHADLPVFLLTGYADLTIAIDAMNKGAIIKYFDKPVDWVVLEAAMDAAIEMYDLTFAQKEIIAEKKAFIVDKIRDLSAEVKTLGYNNVNLNDEIGHLKSDNQKLGLEIEKLRAENSELRGSVAQERKTMLEGMARERKTLEEELARKKDEADRIVEMQIEKNRVELERLQEAFEIEKLEAGREIERMKAALDEDRKAKLAEIDQERRRAEAEQEEIRRKHDAEKAAITKNLAEEKENAAREIERMKAAHEEDRKAKLAEIDQERRRAEVEQEEIRRKHDAEKAEIEKRLEQEKERAAEEIERMRAAFEEDRRAKLAAMEEKRKETERELAAIRTRIIEEKEQLEKMVREQREKAETDIRHFQKSFELEKKNLTEALEAQLETMKKAVEAEAKEIRAGATRELDNVKAEVRKREHEHGEALIQAARASKALEEQLKDAKSRIRDLEAEAVKSEGKMERLFEEIESMKADYNLAIQSREALAAEVDELRDMLR